MSNILGDIIVRLLANTASFESGMNAASKQAQRTGKEVQGVFNEIGDAAEKILAPLGSIGTEFAAAISGVGSAARSMLTTLGPLGPAFGSVGLGIAGVGAIAAAAGVGVLGLAAHASEAAAHLYDLSQSTGISVPILSGLGEVAKISGIGVDQLAKGLERMSKSALAAAEAGPKSSNAYRQLGVSVTNSNGQLRSAEAIFEDVATKLAALPDGAQKTALAMGIFGKAGADLIPIINRGGEEIAELVGHFKKLGAVLDTDTAAASEKFRENLILIGAALSGVQNQLLKDLIPALDVFTKDLVKNLENGQSQARAFVDGIADLGKVILTLIDVGGLIISSIGESVKVSVANILVLYDVLAEVQEKYSHADFSGAYLSLKEGFDKVKESVKSGAIEMHDTVVDQIAEIGKLWSATTASQAPPSKAHHGTVAPPGAANTDFVDQAGLHAQADAEKALAAAMAGTMNASLEERAAFEGGAVIDNLYAEAVQKATINGKLNSAMLGELNAKISALLPTILAAKEEQLAFKDALSVGNELDAFISKTLKQAAALAGEADAVGRVAQSQAKNLASLTPLTEAIAHQQAVVESLTASTIVDISVKDLAIKNLADLEARYARAAQAIQLVNEKLQASEFAKEQTSLKLQISALEENNSALLQGGEAYAAIDEQVRKLTTDLNLNAEQQATVRAELERTRALKVEGAADALVSNNNPATNAHAQDLLSQISYLQQVEAQWKAQGKDVQAVVLAIQQLQGEYDQLTLKTNSYTAGAKAGWDELLKQTQTNAQFTFDLVTKGYQGFEDQLVDTLTGAKTHWQDYFASLEKMALKFFLNKSFSLLLGDIGGALKPPQKAGSGSGGVWSETANGAPTAIPGIIGAVTPNADGGAAGGPAGGILGRIGSIFKQTPGGSGPGGILSKIESIFKKPAAAPAVSASPGGAAASGGGLTQAASALSSAAASLQSSAGVLSSSGSTLSTAASTLTTSSSTLQEAATKLISAANTLSSSGGGNSGGGGISSMFGGDDGGDSGGDFGDFVGDSGDTDGMQGVFGGYDAKGGDVTPGLSYVVGEEGPEVFTPGASGAITQNTATGKSGGDTHIHVDARGADAGVEQRVMRAIRDMGQASVQRSIASFADINKRLPG